MNKELWQQLLFGLTGGIALLLYGMVLISNGFQKALGDKATKMLEKVTNHPLKGILSGTVISTVFQSSSLTMVTLIGLVNSGALALTPAIGVMLGAEIGTTVTAQIVAFKVTQYALPIVAIGFFMNLLSKKPEVRYIGQALMGFGIIFLGMIFIREGVKPLESLPYFQETVVSFGQIPLYGILIGAIFAALIHSSAATIGIVIAMATEKVIGVEVAIPLILGANIGTTVTGFIASLNSSKTAKKLSFAQIFINVLGVAIIFFFVTPFIAFVKTTSIEAGRQIANAHTIFNVASAVIGLLFVNKLVDLVERIVPGKDLRQKNGTKYIDNLLLDNPSAALVYSSKEIYDMAKMVNRMIKETKEIYQNFDKEKVAKILVTEDNIDYLYAAINQYLTTLTTKPINVENSEKITTQIHVISDIERASDHMKNLALMRKDMEKRKITFSREANKEILTMLDALEKIFTKSIKIIKTEQRGYLEEIKAIEEEIDNIERKAQTSHIARMKSGKCNPEVDVIFVSVLRNIERAGDHSNNIANEILIKSYIEEPELV